MVGTSNNFMQVFNDQTRVYRSGRDMIETTDVTEDEKGQIGYVFDRFVESTARIAPSIAGMIAKQKGLAMAFAGVAKAKIPTTKSITSPSQQGGLGVVPLIPQWFNYTGSPSGTVPSYTSYTLNSWNISVTAGTAAYLMGDGTNYYKTKPTDSQHIEILIFDGGIIEVGTSPKVDQWRLYSQNETKYGVYTETALYDQPIDPNRPIYQHDTPLGAIIATHDFGFMWKFMPNVTGTVNMRLLGLAVYEHDWATDVKWNT